MPAQPSAWQRYNVSYNQSKVEDCFDDLPGRIWRGLVANLATYDRPNASPIQAQVLALFRGGALDVSRLAYEV
jgi:hypothetical protein